MTDQSPKAVPLDGLASTIGEIAERKGHAVDNARDALAVLDAAIAQGVLHPSSALTAMMDDLRLALAQDEGARLGGKSAEAARMILRAMVRELGRR